MATGVESKAGSLHSGYSVLRARATCIGEGSEYIQGFTN